MLNLPSILEADENLPSIKHCQVFADSMAPGGVLWPCSPPKTSTDLKKYQHWQDTQGCQNYEENNPPT